MEHPDFSVAQSRAEQVAELQSRIMDEYNASLLGEVTEAICDGYDAERGMYFGRTYADSPEIDGGVWFRSETPLKTGDFAQVLIEGEEDGDLLGLRVEVR